MLQFISQNICQCNRCEIVKINTLLKFPKIYKYFMLTIVSKIRIQALYVQSLQNISFAVSLGSSSSAVVKIVVFNIYT